MLLIQWVLGSGPRGAHPPVPKAHLLPDRPPDIGDGSPMVKFGRKDHHGRLLPTSEVHRPQSEMAIKQSLPAEQGFDELPTEAMEFDEEQKVVVFDCFAGIGGLSRALELAEVLVQRLVVIEKEKECRRVNVVRYPGAEVWTDIKKVTRRALRRF